ncbi:MAG: hypothetical protein FWG80_01350 [Alphaproteobacteria bacterium]|nr:hypothetical protein [Alphaproteobacteria bacterium]
MDTILIIGFATALLVVCAVIMALMARRSQKAAESLMLLLTRPERMKVQDAARVLQVVLAGEIEKIESNFKSISGVLDNQIQRADELSKHLGQHNALLVGTADEASRKMTIMNQRLENMLTGFDRIVNSQEWSELESAAERFHDRINDLLNRVDASAQDAIERTKTLQGHIDGWIDSGKKMSAMLHTDMESNTSQMNSMVVESDAMKEKLESLAKTVAEGFGGVRREAVGYEASMVEGGKLLDSQLEKLDDFTKKSKTLLVTQINGLTNTANSVGAQIRLAEASMEKQEKILRETITEMTAAAQNTEGSVRNVVGEVSILAGKFNGEIKDFTSEVVSELKAVQGVANNTLDDTKAAAGAFSESVRTMAEGVRETLIEMNNAHTMLTSQSDELIKVSADTTAQLQPLSELIERYTGALPELTSGSAQLSEQLENDINTLEEKIAGLHGTMETSIVGIADSSMKLDHLAGESRQQMIDLMSDYAKAVDTMKTLTAQMAETRASAPMKAVAKGIDAMASGGSASVAPRISADDFIGSAGALIERLHELSVDLTRAVGAEIPDAVWAKYHSGDKSIFSKWFAKMLNAADKRKVKDLFKSDAVFRSQATQFVRGFAKMLAGAEQTDNRELIVGTLLKTDLGQMYLALKAYL